MQYIVIQYGQGVRNMLLALDSLGLPVGTQGWREVVAFAHAHPTLFIVENMVFVLLLWALGLYANRMEKKNDSSRRGA